MENDNKNTNSNPDESKLKETKVILNLLINQLAYHVQNQNYLLMVLEDLAELKAKTNGTKTEEEIAKIGKRFKEKELSSTLVMAQNLLKTMGPELSTDIGSILDILKSKNN